MADTAQSSAASPHKGGGKRRRRAFNRDPLQAMLGGGNKAPAPAPARSPAARGTPSASKAVQPSSGAERAPKSRKRQRKGAGGSGEALAFSSDFLDHFETPLAAYRDIEEALDAVARGLGKSRASLRVYDPYYCRGAAARHLAALGFSDVHNANEDFYSSARYSDASLFDVVVTNPPYSGDHKERCLTWLRGLGKPWFCLMWAHSAAKQWYTQSAHAADWFLAPTGLERYQFRHPEGKGKQDGSPHLPLWFCNTASVDHARPHTRPVHAGLTARPGLRIATSLKQLQQQGAVRAVRRGNPRQRAKARLRAAAQAESSGPGQ